MLINQWNSVVRWELRTKLFLRTLEFFWQEGHTAHATLEEAEAETRQMLDIYTDFAVNEAAVPVIPGRKSASERFAGADQTYSIEAMMGDGKALQAGTSHNLGQNFAKAFDIRYLDREGALQFCWTTSWGLSTRFIGAIIMVHGDDQGLILPPRVAPTQVVIVPIFKTDEEKALVFDAARKASASAGRCRAFACAPTSATASAPASSSTIGRCAACRCASRSAPRTWPRAAWSWRGATNPARKGSRSCRRKDCRLPSSKALEEIQKALLERARAFRDANTNEPKNYDEFKAAVETGFALAFWCGSADCEAKIKEETKATMRCIPLDQPGGQGACILCGQPATEKGIFGRAY